MHAPVFEALGLSVSFTQYVSHFRRARTVNVRDLSLSVGSRELVAVVGASGAGKSLLAHAILGLLPYNADITGTLRFCGKPLTAALQRSMRGREIVLVPQSVTALDPLMRVENQLRRGRGKKDWAPKIKRGLARYGLPAGTGRLYPFQLSGGMTRRVLIANALLEQPRLIIADEPTPGLDAPTARRVLGHFRELADAGAAVLLITHDLELALSCADRVVVLHGGTAVEEAATADFERPDRLRHPYTRALWHAMPGHAFQPLSAPLREGPGCPFSPVCKLAETACDDAADIPYRACRGGRVRCLKEDAI